MKPPDDLKDWSKNELVRELRRLRAVLREHAERLGDDTRESSSADPVIGGSPHGRGDALVDARAAVLMDHVDVVLVDTKREDGGVVMLLSLAGRINYSDDHVTNAYLFGGDGAAAIVSQIIGLASRAAGMHDDPHGTAFAADFKVALEARMGELP